MKIKELMKIVKNKFGGLIVAGIMAGILACPCEVAASGSTFYNGSFTTDDDPVVIFIDPGHGGEQDGCKYEYDGQMILEKDLNLKIALALRDELETYNNVEVVMLREDDSTFEQQERADIAYAHKADYYISVHNNATGEEGKNPDGVMVLVPINYYQVPGAKCPDRYGIATRMGTEILNFLRTLGLNTSPDFPEFSTNGLVRRPYSPEGGASVEKFYPDGSTADYYSQLRFTGEYGIPALVIEHAYVSNENDYKTYLSDDEKLKKLGVADGAGIAQALHLTKDSPETFIENASGVVTDANAVSGANDQSGSENDQNGNGTASGVDIIDLDL